MPKPLHGWRALIGEVCIIVIGVLIALGAEQVVEELRWEQRVSVVRKSLMGELGNDRGRWEFDVAATKCAVQAIDKIDAWVRSGQSSAFPDPDGYLQTRFQIFWMHSANWNLATGSQAVDHFPINEQLALAALYDGVAHRQVDILSAANLADRIRALIPLATDAQGRRDLRLALGELKMTIGGLRNNEAYMRRHFDAVGVRPDRSDFSADIGRLRCG